MNSSYEKKNDTINKTTPYTGAGLNGTTYQRRNSQSRSTTSDISMDNNFQISTQSLMPFLEAMKNENEHFKQEKDKLSHEMQTLQNITQNLLLQNQALRLHYQERSNDVKSLIQTFTINVNQDLSETKHLIHFYREHNTILAKHIQQITGKTAEHEYVITNISKQLNNLVNENAREEENWRNRQVKNRMAQKNIEKLEKKIKQSKIQKLEQEICDLQVQNNLLKKKNINTLNYIRAQKLSLSNQRPQVKTQTIEVIKSVKMLKAELESIERHYSQLCHKNDVSISNEQNIIRKFQTIFANSESKRRKLQKLSDERKQVEENSIKLKESNEVLRIQKEKKEAQKNLLQKQIQLKKQEILNAKNSHEKKKNILIQQNAQKIEKLREEIRKSENNLSKAMLKQLNPEKEQSQNLLVNLKRELQMLENEVKETKQKIEGMPNPLKQIMKIQLQLKQLRSK